MPVILSQTPKMNLLILDAALDKEPVFDAFKRLCNTPGYRNMDYVDFEWNYYQCYQYYHGNRVWTIERGLENSSPVTFSDLPMHVLERVVGKSDFRDRLRLRKVSSGVRNLVDSTECSFDQLKLSDHYYSIAFEDSQIKYHRSKKSCRIESSMSGKLKTNMIPKERMMTDALEILKNPRLKIGCLEITIYGSVAFTVFSEFLSSLNVQLDVRSIDIHPRHEDIRPILEFVKPGCLEEIKIHAYHLTCDQWNEIAETEQWKRAKRLECCFFERFQMGKMLHFKEIEIEGFRFTDANLLQVRDLLLQSDRLELCILDCWIWSGRDSEEALERFLNREPLYNSQSRCFSIPNSKHYFQLELGRYNREGVYRLTINKML